MTDADDDFDTEDGLDEVRELIRTRGVKAAYTALVEVCEDRKAAAPARSSAGTSLFRAAGLFDRKEGDGIKELHEMTGDELRAVLAKGKRALKRAAGGKHDAIDSGGSVFD